MMMVVKKEKVEKRVGRSISRRRRRREGERRGVGEEGH